MTTLICWSGVDQRRRTSLYFASDSRISWLPGEFAETGPKVFHLATQPMLLGFTGYVEGASALLHQVKNILEAFVKELDDEDHALRVSIVEKIFTRCLSTWNRKRIKPFNETSILIGTRQYSNMNAVFGVSEVTFNDGQVFVKRIELPPSSGLVAAFGSGADEFMKVFGLWQGTRDSHLFENKNFAATAGTSRAAFSAFCEHLRSGKDSKTGGAPQLVGIWAGNGGARRIGTIYNNKSFLSGIEIREEELIFIDKTLEWRDELDQRCDPVTKARLVDANPQPRPRPPKFHTDN